MSINEWGSLKKVIVGIVDNAKMPTIDLSVRTVTYADQIDDNLISVGNYPQSIIEEENNTI